MVLAATLSYKFVIGKKASWKDAIIYGIIYTVLVFIGFKLIVSLFGLSGPLSTFNGVILLGYLLMFAIAYLVAKYYNKLGEKEVFKVALWTVLITIIIRSTFAVIGFGLSGFLIIIGING